MTSRTPTPYTHDQVNLLFLAAAIEGNKRAALYYLKRGSDVLEEGTNIFAVAGADINFTPPEKDESPETRKLLFGYRRDFLPLHPISALSYNARSGNMDMSEWLIGQGARLNNALANAAYGFRYHTRDDRIENMGRLLVSLVAKGARLDQQSWYLKDDRERGCYPVQGTPWQALHDDLRFIGEFQGNVIRLMETLKESGENAVLMANDLLTDPKKLEGLIFARTPANQWAGPRGVPVSAPVANPANG